VTAQESAAERSWRLWASVSVVAGLIVACLFGFIVVPLVQGRSIGLDPFTAICRSLGILPGTPAVSGPSSAAKPVPVSNVAWTPQVIRRLAAPNVQNGNDLAVNVCSACHGDHGVSTDPQFPNLAGQSTFAIYKQLHDFKDGTRQNDTMSAVVQDLDDSQMADVAAHFSALNLGDLDPGSPHTDDPTIVKLVQDGDPSRGLPACAACHSPRAGGPIEIPTLVGLRKEYIVAQLQDFANGERKNDLYGRMRNIASKLTPQEIEAVAQYYSQLR
jgi:cytochrome c553